jgi:hypothetical protein
MLCFVACLGSGTERKSSCRARGDSGCGLSSWQRNASDIYWRDNVLVVNIHANREEEYLYMRRFADKPGE